MVQRLHHTVPTDFIYIFFANVLSYWDLIQTEPNFRDLLPENTLRIKIITLISEIIKIINLDTLLCVICKYILTLIGIFGNKSSTF